MPFVSLLNIHGGLVRWLLLPLLSEEVNEAQKRKIFVLFLLLHNFLKKAITSFEFTMASSENFS